MPAPRDFQLSQLTATIIYANITFTSAAVTTSIPAGSSYEVTIAAAGVSAGERCVVTASAKSLAMYEVVAQSNQLVVTVTNPRKTSSIELADITFTVTVLRG